MEECPFGIYRFNLTTARYEQANPALLQLLGYGLDDFCSSPMPAIYVDAAECDSLLAQLLDEGVAPIVIDPDQLAIVLLHLADNARAAMPQGGQLRISTAGWPGNPGHSESGSSEACALLTISDTGVGMDEKTLARIFEPFFSTKKTTLTAGLGLSTSHGIISQSNGRIECESSPGNGTTFRIYLPLASTRHRKVSNCG